MNRRERVRTGVKRFEHVRTGVKYCFSHMVSRTLSKFCRPFNEATPAVHFWPLNVRGIPRVLLVYINRLVCMRPCVHARACVCVCVCVCVCTIAYSLQILPTTLKLAYRYLTVPRSKPYDPGGNSPSSRSNWQKV